MQAADLRMKLQLFQDWGSMQHLRTHVMRWIEYQIFQRGLSSAVTAPAGSS